MAIKYPHPQPCTICGGQQFLVYLDEHDGKRQYNWRVKLPGRGLGDAFSGRHVSNVSTYACSSCRRLTFYVDNIMNLLE